MAENYCKNCGAENDKDANVCIRCGFPAGAKEPEYNQRAKNKLNIFLLILSALIPIIGLVLYGLDKYQSPRTSSVYLKVSACGVVVYMLAATVVFIGMPIVNTILG